MDPFTLTTAATGLIGGLLGGKKRRNPFQQQMNAQTQTLTGIGNSYGDMARTASARQNIFRPQADRALNTEVDYLQQDPFTDSTSARILGKATDGLNANYDAARANLGATIARRGLSGDSSAQTGGDAAIETARSSDISGAQNNLALQSIAQRGQNLSRVTGLLGGAADKEYDNELNATGLQGNVAGNLLQFYTGQNNEANAEADQDYNQQLQALSGAGNLIGGAVGGGRATNPFRSGAQPLTNGGDDEEAYMQYLTQLMTQRNGGLPAIRI